MTGRFLLGLLFGLVAFTPLIMAALLWRRRLLPSCAGAEARLVEAIAVLSAALVLSEVSGLFGLFRLWVIAPAFAAIGIAGCYFARGGPMKEIRHPEGRQPHLDGRWQRFIGLAVICLVAADWLARVAASYAHGMTSVDTLWYHMPFAARFVQQHSLTQLHYVDSQAVTVFFPSNSEVFHALGIMFMGSDVLSPALNMGWLGFALVAAWVFGRRLGVPWMTVSGTAALFSTPGLVATQPGGAYDDVVALATLLAAVGLVGVAVANANVAVSRWLYVIAGLAAGLSLGTKYTLLVPIAALTIGMFVIVKRDERVRAAASWLSCLIATGGFWYIRNAVVVGNPIPSLHVKLGPISLPYAVSTTQSSTFARFVADGASWRLYFLPGLRLSFGPGWWALLGAAALGVVFGIVRGGSLDRMLSFVAVAALVGFMFTPQYLAILGKPLFFVDNVRYADPAILLGVIILPTVSSNVVKKWVSWPLWLSFGVVVANQFSSSIWPIGTFHEAFATEFASPPSRRQALVGLGVVLAIAAVGLCFAALRHRKPGFILPAGIIVTGLVLIGAIELNTFYLNNRYTSGTARGTAGISALVQGIENSRFGVAGAYSQLQYPFYGRHLNNYVQYIGEPEPGHGYSPITTCAQWIAQVNTGHYDYIYVTAGPGESPQQLARSNYSYTTWTDLDPSSRLLRRGIFRTEVSPRSRADVEISLYRLNGPLHLSTCSDAQARDVIPTQT